MWCLLVSRCNAGQLTLGGLRRVAATGNKTNRKSNARVFPSGILRSLWPTWRPPQASARSENRTSHRATRTSPGGAARVPYHTDIRY
jgi:hypothetical protein